MNKKIFAWGLFMLTPVAYGIFDPFDSDHWKALHSDVVAWFRESIAEAKKGVRELPDCMRAQELAAEWSIKKARYQTKLIALQAAEDAVVEAERLQHADPRVQTLRDQITAKISEKNSLKSAREKVLCRLDDEACIAEATGSIGERLDMISRGMFHITACALKTPWEKIAQGVVPLFEVTARIAKDTMKITVPMSAYDDVATVAQAILNTIIQDSGNG